MPPKEKTTELPLQYREALFVPASAGTDTIDVTWTTGAGVLRYDWRTGSEYLERLSVDPAHVHLELLNAGAPVLDAHNGWSALDVRGNVEKAWLEEGGVGAATLRFDLEDPKAAELFRKAKGKFVRGVSVGYEVHHYEETFTEGKLTERLAISWTPREISICPMGADHGGQVRDAKSAPKTTCKLTRRSVAPQPKPSAPKKDTPMKKLFQKRGTSITTAKAKELAAKWITLVAGDDAKTTDLAMEIMAFVAGEETAEGEAKEPADPNADGEMSAVEEAAREVTGLTNGEPDAKVVSALYKMEVRAAGATSSRQGLSEANEKARAAKLKRAQDEGRLTPAEAKLLERRLKQGKLTDEDLDEELALDRPKVGPGAPEVNPPAPQDPEAGPTNNQQRSAQPTPQNPSKPPTPQGDDGWKKAVNPAMTEYCQARNLNLEFFARSWAESNPTRPYEKPSDRKN